MQRSLLAMVICLVMLVSAGLSVAHAEEGTHLEKAVSDTLDSWREGRFEQLYEQLTRRGKTSREAFVTRMKSADIRPACCFQKLQHFKILNEKRTEATVYARVGLEGAGATADSCTREFKLTHEQGVWKMQLADILSLSGVSGKKGKHVSRRKTPSPYHN